MKVVLDTNILISGTFWTGDSYRILSLIDKGKIELVLSQAIIDEYRETMKDEETIEKIIRKKLVILDLIEKVIKEATIVNPLARLDAVPGDKDDNIILECVMEDEVGYIITNDNHLLRLKSFKGIPISTPTEFLTLRDHKS